MKTQTVQLVQSSFAQVAAIADTVAPLFYAHLFRRDPSLRPLFRGDMQAQGAKLMQMIAVAVNRLGYPETLVPVLENMGRGHTGYGVVDAHYDTVGAALVDTLADGLGDAFTTDVRAAWIEVYGVIATTMQRAAADAALAA
jgi:hemoglobin-like flavoprotein